MSLPNLANKVNILCQKIKNLQQIPGPTGPTGATGADGSGIPIFSAQKMLIPNLPFLNIVKITDYTVIGNGLYNLSNNGINFDPTSGEASIIKTGFYSIKININANTFDVIAGSITNFAIELILTTSAVVSSPNYPILFRSSALGPDNIGGIASLSFDLQLFSGDTFFLNLRAFGDPGMSDPTITFPTGSIIWTINRIS